MDDKQFNELKDKLGVITQLLALNLIRDLKLQKDQITRLASFGFQPSQIAGFLNTTANSVRVTLSKARRKGKETT